jgi:cytochrome c oxidase cbb3-type subunit 3
VRRLTGRGARGAFALCLVGVAAAGACGGPTPGGASADALAGGPPSVRYDQNVSAGGIAPPGGQLENPFRGDKRSAADGEALFKTMNCDGCHGGGGEGWVGPSLISGRWRYGGADGVVFQSVYYGRPDGMPAFGGILAPPLAWKIVTYLKSLPPPKDVPTESW